MSKKSRTNKQFHTTGMMILLCGILILPVISENVTAVEWINVTSPYSGQTWYQGQTYTITWDSYDVGDAVKIELYKSGSYYSTITSSTSNDGYYSWTVPSNTPVGSAYYIRISNITGTVYDNSGYFSVDSRSITVTSPYSGGTWHQGGTYTISWNSDDAGNYVKIELYKSGSYHSTITSSAYTYSYGSYSWTIPSDISPGSSYQIKITSNTYSSVYDYSSYFSIDERTITITSPSEGDTWYRGEASTITWTSDVSGYVGIELYKNDSFYSTLKSSTYNDGNYYWTVPSNLPIGSSYQIKITSTYYSSIYDFSDYFSIDERFIAINSPSSNDVWYKEEESTITWDSKNAGSFVTIELYSSYSFHSTITSNTSNDGSYLWAIPSSLSTKSSYQIRITGMPDGVVTDYSDYFRIDERTISVVSPSGGEIWYLGETYAIRWNSENIGKLVDIELYEDGEYHSTIASDASNNGYYSWTVPGNLNLSSEYSIKIASTSYDDVFEYSSGYVAIEKPLIQSWLGNLIIILCLIIVLIIIFVLFKTKKIKIPKLSKSSENVGKTQESLEAKHKIRGEKISQEEYDQIWEER
jgi:uncharacterized membrane protein